MNPKSILCVRPDNMGDILMTEPAIRALDHTFGDAKITLFTSSMGKAITKYIPEIDDVIVFDLPWLKLERTQTDVLQLVEELRKKAFDMAVIFNTYSQSALPTATICYLAGIPHIVGYAHENPYGLINHWVPDTEPYSELQHEVVRQCKLVQSIGAAVPDNHIKIHIPKTATQKVQTLLQEKGIESNKTIIMHPGCSEEKRRFPVKEFSETAKLLINKGYHIVVTGSGAAEKALGEQFISITGTEHATYFIDIIDLEEFLALVSLVPLIITNNTGPAHIAAAVQTPVLVLYARTNPQHAPWRVPSTVLLFDFPVEQRSKNQFLQHTFPKDRLASPTPEQIASEALSLLSRTEEVTPGVLW